MSKPPFRAHEVEAIQTAQPTPDAHDLIRAWKATGCSLAIVSNNSQTAVETYLEVHRLRHHVDAIAARASSNTSLLKPSPKLLVHAIEVLNSQPSRCALIGDSNTDMQAAKTVSICAVGYANRSSKADDLARYGADAMVTVMISLLAALP